MYSNGLVLSFLLLMICCLVDITRCIRMEELQDVIDLKLGSSYGIHEGKFDIHALHQILEGVKNGNKESIYFYGLIKLYGNGGLPRNVTTAAINFKLAGDLGHPEALTAYGVMCMTGMGITQDNTQAISYFRRAIDMGDLNAHWLLGKLYCEGKGVDRPQYAEAATHFRIAAEASIPQAEHYLGLLYEYGHGVDVSYSKASEYYRRAAEKQFLESQYNLGLMYAYGRDGNQDFRRAISMFQKAALDNHAPSCYYMGLFKLHGYGCEPNYQEALNWFERTVSLDDKRVMEQATHAINELKKSMESAEVKNEMVIEKYKRMSEVQL